MNILQYLIKRYFTKTYKLSAKEKIIWKELLKVVLIHEKKHEGEHSWDRDFYNFNKEQNDLLDKIHNYFYKDWWIADPISTCQVNYIMFHDIKYKILL